MSLDRDLGIKKQIPLSDTRVNGTYQFDKNSHALRLMGRYREGVWYHFEFCDLKTQAEIRTKTKFPEKCEVYVVTGAERVMPPYSRVKGEKRAREKQFKRSQNIRDNGSSLGN